ncbi:hypothetical protein LIER_44112 [Lithospermum erythrorhizon]|uniref:Uncharacterized protein n=1 Tax=Lithospermum erythrorhizon TaxID=34254 RepID=A0AAV3PWH9_LITER
MIPTVALLLLLTIVVLNGLGVLRLPSEMSGRTSDDRVGTRWAVLIAGSNGYWNYRHQGAMMGMLGVSVEEEVRYGDECGCGGNEGGDGGG